MKDWQNLVYIGIAVLLVVGLFYLFVSRPSVPNYGEVSMPPHPSSENEEAVNLNEKYTVAQTQNYESLGSENASSVSDNSFHSEQSPPCLPRDQLKSQDLLPKDESSEWAKLNPIATGALQGQNFLDASQFIGVNTVGQSLGKNPNLQIRSEPPNPQVQVSPWSQSSIMPDTSRRYFEVGQC